VTVERTVETVAALVPAAFVAQVVMPPSDTWGERLGVAAVLVVAFYFVVRWFMAQMEKKDDVIKEITASHIKAQAENTATIVQALHEGHDVKRQMTEAVTRLTGTLERMGPR
jgi:membrane protein implicated in regulation of membrane protease activity